MADDTSTPNPLLQVLKDIEMPEPVSWWPPAPGWWVLALVALALLVWMMLRLKSRYQSGASKREAIATLKATYATYTETDDATGYLDSVSQLLRRLCIQAQGRGAVARLTGDAWTENLNGLSDNPLSDAAASALGSGRYRSNPDIPVSQLHPELVALVDGFRLRPADRPSTHADATDDDTGQDRRNARTEDTINA